MLRNKTEYFIATLLLVVVSVIGANAGGPLIIFNNEQRIPYRYDVTSPVPVYTDLGLFGAAIPGWIPEVSNERGDEVVAFALKQWTDVETSSFQAQVAGDFASIGLPDANDAATAAQVIGAENGGGIHVIYDADAMIMQTFFGAPSTTLGIASPEFADFETGVITESWVIINGQGRSYGDDNIEKYAGVVTHEFGHSINLAHSQTNGAIAFFGDGYGPNGCTSLPYPKTLTLNQIETMYPYIQPNATGKPQSTVDMGDDKVAISDIYPTEAYLASKASITGRVLMPGGKSGITGVNVIARNLDNPYADAVSAMSGDYVRVEAGNDGSFTLNGLTPGARYALYTDGIRSPGSFATMAALYTPGPEEFYNGANENDDALSDDPCSSEPLTVTAGSSTQADITLNTVKGAPKFRPMVPNTVPTSITTDGRTIGGAIYGIGTFRYTDEKGYEQLGDTPSISPKISRDGSSFVGEKQLGADRLSIQASILKFGGEWQAIPVPTPDAPVVAAPCDTTSSSYGVADGGKAATGLIWIDANGDEPGGGCRAWPFLWTANGGTKVLPLPSMETKAARPNNMSADGSTVVGWWEDPNGNGTRFGLRWENGVVHQFSTPGLTVGEAYNATPDGSTIVGMNAGPNWEAWRWTRTGGVKLLGRLAPAGPAIASALSDDGNVVAGLSGTTFGSPWEPATSYTFLWTPELGTVDFPQFLMSQGTWLDGYRFNNVTAMNGDGTKLIGTANGPLGTTGYIVELDKVDVCHAPPGNPANHQTINVPFRGSMADHLKHGDTVGACVDAE